MTTANEQRPDAPAPLTTLLADARPSWDELGDRYGPLLGLVNILLGVVPNCDRYLEIWPPAFRTYNIMVPNLLNLPVPIFGLGGPPPGVVGTAMYVASQTAECPYCSAHTCSFAMRRGASPDKVAAALLPERTGFTRGELAAIAVARSLARVPCELTTTERDELVGVFGRRHAEQIVLSVVMMGFLNKFMDAVGVELEEPVVAEVSATIGTGWSPGKAGLSLDPAAPARPAPPADGLRAKLRVLPLLPGAVRFDMRVQRGVPSRWPAAGRFLEERTGHDFPVLGQLQSGRARRAITSMLRENLDLAITVVGLDVKVLAGAVFAAVVGNDRLAGDVRALAPRRGIEPAQLDAMAAFGRGEAVPLPADPKAAAALALALAASPSPARVDGTTVEACRDGGLSPAAMVEVISWLSVLQMLHRLTCFIDCEADVAP